MIGQTSPSKSGHHFNVMFTLPRRHAVGRCCRTILAHPTDRNFAIRRITSTAKTCADSDAPTATPPIAVETNEAWVFIDSIFPITLGAWEYVKP
jgi:hypothetical protein